MRYLSIVFFLLICNILQAQTKTTENLHKNNKEAFTLFFYQNTLRMFNQEDDKDLDELIKGIEKMKFVLVDKKKFGSADYKKLVSGYKSESFEEIMTSRFEGKNFDVFLKEVSGQTKGMVIAVNDAERLMVLDIVGSIALDKITKFLSSIDKNTEIGDKIRSFTKEE
jgi:hypothetical protein